MLNILKNTINRVFASGVDSDASAFITATGLSSTTQKSAITTLVKDLKASGLWSKMKAVYPMVTDNRNLFSYSEDFTNAFWVKNNSTVTLNSATAPNGTLTADTLIPSAGTNIDNPTVYVLMDTAAQTRTFSFYAKSAGYNYAYARVGGSVPVALALFDLSNGTVTQTQSPTSSASIESVGNGWYRCQMTYPNSATYYAPNIGTCSSTYTISSTGITTTTNGTSGIYIWGAQLEQSSTATTYQPISTTPSAFMASQMKYNLKDARDLDAAFRLTWSGGWTYSANGATPNGTNAYADTKLNLLSNLSGYDSSFSVYYRQDLYGTYKIGAFGANFDQGISAHLGWTNSSGTLYNDHLGRNTIVNSTYGTFNAYHISSVTSTASQKLYRNGVLKVSGAATSGITMPSLSFYFGAANANGTANYFDPKQIAFGTLSTGLTDSDAMLLNQIVEKYQVALSRGVQAAQSFYYNSAYSNEANTYLYSTQITGTTQVSAINTLINGLKANNLWSKMKAVYPFVTDYRNILGFTEDFGDGSWTKGNSTVTTNSTTAPNGTLTADSLVENTASSTHLVSNTSGITTSTDNYTLSVYAKKANRDWVYLNLYNGTTSLFAWFNLNTGIVGTVQAGLTASIQDAGSGWFRLSVTRTLASTSNCYIQYGSASADNTTTFVGNGLVAAYIWGAQLELGTSASAYQAVLATNNYSTNVAAQMKFNLVNPQDSDAAFRLAFSGGWTYSTNGAQPNGVNGFAYTSLIPDNNGLTANSNSLSFYSRTSAANGATQFYEMGSGNTTGTDLISLYTRRSTDIAAYDTGSFALNRNSYTNTDGSGYYIGKINSDLTSKVFRNGVLKGTKTITNQATLSSFQIYLGGFNENNTTVYFSPKQVAFAHIGTGLSDAEVAILNQLVTDYETTLNRNV